MSATTPESIMVVSVVAAFFSIFRFAVDLIMGATDHAEKNEKKSSKNKKKDDDSSSVASSSSPPAVGVTSSTSTDNNNINHDRVSSTGKRVSLLLMRKSLQSFRRGNDSLVADSIVEQGGVISNGEDEVKRPQMEIIMSYISVFLQLIFFIYFLTMTILVAKNDIKEDILYDAIPLGALSVGSFFSLLTSIRDFQRKRFTSIQRLLYILFTVMSALAIIFFVALAPESTTTSTFDYISMAVMIVYSFLALLESKIFSQIIKTTDDDDDGSGIKKKKHLGKSLLVILKPYFWPNATALSSASMNRFRAIMTWVCVSASRACSVISPIFLGRASTALAVMDYATTAKYAAIYCCIQFSSTFLRECQSLFYLRVAQAAFVQLSELSFHHLHSLSLDWHLKKKLGEVIRSMDRGILSCDTLMKYLFLWLVPAIAECLLVCIIFATYFDYLPLALSIFSFVFVYIVWTIIVTLWRKKFRKSVAKSDNDWHDICTDSLINFETVKYFTAEQYEIKRFSNSIKEYQNSSVNVQASLSLLNITQMVLMQFCLGTALVLATFGIQKRSDCCISNGCADGTSDCCTSLSDEGICTGMEVGDFVAVLTYTLNLFQPLNFLGSVYNAIVMALIDLRHLSELLVEEPDLNDAADAMDLPATNETDPDIAVEFDDVLFKYPSQAEGQGLKGVSFKMKRGTTTAIVGTTGAGKTTISRLFFRFYDVLGGAVKVNGVDVRSVKQKSLREAIGVVPQSTSMFNDTLQENVKYGKRDATMEELDKVAADAQLLSFIRSLPEGWDTVIGDRGLKLSGGEKQRTAIARCLLKDPPFVVLDEATSALDTVTENSIQEALDALGSHRTCLVIAHRLGTIRHADNIVVLGDGVVIEQVSLYYLLPFLKSNFALIINSLIFFIILLHQREHTMNFLKRMANTQKCGICNYILHHNMIAPLV